MTAASADPSRQARLLARRDALRAESAALRADFIVHVEPLRTPLAVAERVRRGVDWLSRHRAGPLIVLLLAGVRVARGSRPRVRAGRGGVAAPLPHVGPVAAVVATAAGAWVARAWWAWQAVRLGWRAVRALAPAPRRR
jgi:hypothetical protein